MTLPARVLFLALSVSVSALVAPLTSPEAPPEVRQDKPGEAMAFRSLSLRGDAGEISPDGLMRAKRKVKDMKDRLAAVAAGGSLETGDPIAMRSLALARSGWTWIGPGNVGGRVRAVLVHPSAPTTMFAGSVSGGIWKTTDGGASWSPVDDFMANLAVTSMIFKPTNPQIMYAATGEGFSNADAIRGAGIFKSLDGGATWSQLPSTNIPAFHYVLRLAMSRDGRVLLAGTTAGLHRSIDAGATWTRILTAPPAFDVDFHPTDGRRAILGDRNGQAWYSTDGGATWNQALLTLPITDGGSDRVEVAYAKGAPDVVYAVIDHAGGLVFRSIDGGATFVQIVRSDAMPILENGQGWYDLALWVNPRDANDLLVGGVNLFRSRDGGQTFTQVSSPYGQLHADQHIIVEHPSFNNSTNRTLFIGNDGGVYRVNDLARLTSVSNAEYEELNNNLGITQFYGAAGNPATGVIVGGTQDNGTLVFNPGSGSEGWNAMFGGDGGFSAADPVDPNYFYGEHIYLQLHRSTNGGRTSSFIFSGLPDAGRRANFIAPFILDPNQPRRMLAGGQSLWRTNDIRAAAPVWQSIKPGSTSNYISAIAVAEGNANIAWVGHNNGDLYRSVNAAGTAPAWARVDPATFPNRFLARITIDPLDHNVVYVSFGGFTDHNIQRTDDGGVTWRDATGTGATGLPLAPVRDVEVDPTDSNVIWAGTEVGIFTSQNRGATWDATHDGPANVAVDELFVLGDYLYAVTHGRGLFRHRLTDDEGAPALTFFPASRAFPSAQVGSRTDSSPINIVNGGMAPLVIGSAAVGGSHAADFIITSDSCTGRSVEPAMSCALQVAFQPTAAGQRVATIRVTSNAAGSPHTAAVSGAGLTAPAPAGPLPAPWSSRDIGAVGAAGSASFGAGVFAVRGAGADVWGAADAFHYAYQPLNGDGEIVARVSSVQNTAAWVKAGVMIRQSTAPDSAHAFMIVSAGKGLAFQRRRTRRGLTTHTAGGAGVAPAWVKLTRRGNIITAARSADGVTWTTVGNDTIVMTGTVLIGLGVGSHSTIRTATAVFDQVRVLSGSALLPDGWSTRDIGVVGLAGSSSAAGGGFTVRGAGHDIWGATDAFHIAYRTLTGDGTIVARVASTAGTEAWTKTGVMMRGGTGHGAAHAVMLVSVSKGLAFQRRRVNGGLSFHTSGGAGAAPRWVRLVRVGNVVTASVSTNGTTWTTVGQDTIALPASILVGLVVSSHDPTRLATATFDNVGISGLQSSASGLWWSSVVGLWSLDSGPVGFRSLVSGVFHSCRNQPVEVDRAAARLQDPSRLSTPHNPGSPVRPRADGTSREARCVTFASGSACALCSSAASWQRALPAAPRWSRRGLPARSSA
jgi:hypothetical protein